MITISNYLPIEFRGWVQAVIIILVACMNLEAQDGPCVSGNAMGEKFVLKGIAADSSGPLAHRSIIVFPLAQPDGQPVTRFWTGDKKLIKTEPIEPDKLWEYRTGDDGPFAMMNAHQFTDAKGAFSFEVYRNLFLHYCQCTSCKGYKPGQMALGIFISWEKVEYYFSDRDLVTIKFDPMAATVEVGRIVFKPAVAPAEKKRD